MSESEQTPDGGLFDKLEGLDEERNERKSEQREKALYGSGAAAGTGGMGFSAPSNQELNQDFHALENHMTSHLISQKLNDAMLP